MDSLGILTQGSVKLLSVIVPLDVVVKNGYHYKLVSKISMTEGAG